MDIHFTRNLKTLVDIAPPLSTEHIKVPSSSYLRFLICTMESLVSVSPSPESTSWNCDRSATFVPLGYSSLVSVQDTLAGGKLFASHLISS